MFNPILTFLLILLVFPLESQKLYSCLQQSFEKDCKTELYSCTNNAECSYQLHENTHHIFLDQKSETFPPLYFSNQIARNLYNCLKNKCSLPEMDQDYPRTLPFDTCLLQVYDICKGSIQEVYQNPSQAADSQCYRRYCNFPQLSEQ